MRTLYIIPTGEEIRDGTVLDLDSAEIMRQMVKFDPETQVTRLTPVCDVEENIFSILETVLEKKPNLVVLIGGSGGGHRFSSTLGKDFTHTAMEHFLTDYSEHAIYGKNGHMWTRLLCGQRDGMTVINVPGPLVEASAAFAAYLKALGENKGLDEISYDMAEAVHGQFPSEAVKPL